MQNNIMKELTNEQKADNAILWIKRLSTTSVKQAEGELGSSETGFCCLGYGCKILKIDFKKGDADSSDFARSVGLKYETVMLNDYEVNDFERAKDLIELNDDFKFSFRRISTVIKREVETLFEKPVAKIIKEKLGL